MGYENSAEANGVVLNVNIGITFGKFSVMLGRCNYFRFEQKRGLRPDDLMLRILCKQSDLLTFRNHFCVTVVTIDLIGS